MGKGPGARLQPHTPDDAEGHRMLGAQGMMNGKKDGAAGGAAQLGPNLAGEGVQQLAQHLAVMDSTATSLSMDNKIPVLLFALKDPENIYRAIMGEEIGTIVGG